MGAFFSVTVLDHAPGRAGAARLRLRVTQLHADAGHLARIRPARETAFTMPDPSRTHRADVIRALVSRSPRPLSRDELRALVARIIAGATPDNPARRANPLATMREGATGDFSFVREVRVVRIEAYYAPLFAASDPDQRAWFEREFEIDFATKEDEGDPIVDDPDSAVSYRFRVELEARVDASHALHVVMGATFRPPAFV